MAWKDRIFKIINRFSFLFPLNLLVTLTQQKTILPFYHIVSDKKCVHVKHLYTIPSIKKFISDIDFLLKHYKPVSLDELIENKNKKNKIFFLSFDDGLSEVKNIIKPILLEKGVPAHFFINPSFIDNKDLMFRYKVSLLIDKILSTHNPKLLLEIKNILNKVVYMDCDIPLHLKELKYNHINTINDIANLLDVDFNAFLQKQKPYLSKEDVYELIKDGFTIGAHSMDHPEFQYLSIEEQLKQIKQSVDYIDNNFKMKYKTFAFPFTDYNVKDNLFEIIKTKKIVDYTFGGAGLKKEIYDFHFQRIPVETSENHIKKTIKNEYIYYLLKIPFGKNIIRRK
ncbi:MAG: hypothetical protein Kow0068_25730 [Marinilabiliales bacterium]